MSGWHRWRRRWRSPARSLDLAHPPLAARLLVREVSLDFGPIARGAGLEIASEMAEDGVVFADGIEADRLEFADGHRLRIGLAEQKLALVVSQDQPARPVTVSKRRWKRAPERRAAEV